MCRAEPGEWRRARKRRFFLTRGLLPHREYANVSRRICLRAENAQMPHVRLASAPNIRTTMRENTLSDPHMVVDTTCQKQIGSFEKSTMIFGSNSCRSKKHMCRFENAPWWILLLAFSALLTRSGEVCRGVRRGEGGERAGPQASIVSERAGCTHAHITRMRSPGCDALLADVS